jgi:probable O-glycosylation ligase (exosortase A-associated)
MLWTWISLMNPHSLAYGFSQTFPVAAIVAGATIIGLTITRERRNPFISAPVIWLALFMAWMCITYLFSYNLEGSTEMLKKVMKIDVMLLVTLALLNTRKHIETFVWVIVASLGFYGIKGGIFTLTTGGNYRVWGPGGFIGGNNEIALALIITIPFMYYLNLVATNKWIKRGLLAAMLLSAAAALGSHSRGALLAIAAMSVYMWLKSPRKVLFGSAMLVAGITLLLFMPEEWGTRMNTIQTYEEDRSAMGRINAWWMAYNIAKVRITGAGFDMYTPGMFALYAPDPLDIHAAHSIFFQVLGEHGFIGLFLFLGIWWSTWRTAAWLIKNGSKSPETKWCQYLGAMCQVSILGYAVGGTFLSLAYFDLPYNAMVLVVLARSWLERQAWLNKQPINSSLAVAGAVKP